MVERNALCFILADKGLGRIGGLRRGMVTASDGLALRLDDSSGHGVYLILVLIARCFEIYLVDIDAVVTVKLYLIVPDLACGYPCMVERNALCFILADKGLGRIGGPRGGIAAASDGFTLRLDYLAGNRIDIVLVLIACGVELYLIDIYAVVIVELALVVHDLALGHSGIGKGNALCFRLADKGLGRSGGPRGGMVAASDGLTLGLDYLAGYCVYLVIILIFRSIELDLIFPNIVFVLKLYTVVGDIAFIDERMAERNGLCLILADKGLGCAGGNNNGLAPENGVKVADAEPCKVGEAVRHTGVDYGLNELRLAIGYAVFARKLRKRLVGNVHELAEHLSVYGHLREQRIDLFGKAVLQLLACLGIVAFNADEYRVCDLGEVAVLEHGAYYRIDSDFHRAARKVQAFDNELCIIVEGGYAYDPVVLIDLELDARVYVEKHGRISGVGLILRHYSVDAYCYQKERRCGSHDLAQNSAAYPPFLGNGINIRIGGTASAAAFAVYPVKCLGRRHVNSV